MGEGAGALISERDAIFWSKIGLSEGQHAVHPCESLGQGARNNEEALYGQYCLNLGQPEGLVPLP
jgi:hypothetical protein